MTPEKRKRIRAYINLYYELPDGKHDPLLDDVISDLDEAMDYINILEVQTASHRKLRDDILSSTPEPMP